ncbi:serine/threonine-protein kinase [Dokdonella sp.]|uniref:serine/threonine-protein kinase n=1 Tax=Dokdonella sp. TaxID=2291710 RepID=UPI001B13F1DC|nr:serine/threonine-protein kinase [Dokdonella sp.]MBO9663725.1 protein kinase [Dokdonella sp.]
MSSRQARALQWFDAYADLAADERAKALAALRASDPDLHEAVAALFAADALQGPLLQSPQKILSAYEKSARRGVAAVDARIGSTLGAWRIEGVIGAGGMGKVYRASRADGQYAQVVALKCVGTEVDSPVLAEAVRNERGMLAMLEHPNIATLLDGGIDADGYPWFAMQLVQGEPIDRWCDDRRLDVRARVELFIRLCDGLAYAHAKGTLHSDIKPSNVLVDASGRPVLLDFGLSSLAARGRGGERRRVAMTLGYTAPEVSANGYSVKTDLYSLGVMLYELLCGAWPLHGTPIDADTPAPPPPSRLALQGSAQIAQARGLGSAAALSQVLAGDLDQIAGACVAADPAARPTSVEQVQADLRAWLQFKPVSARRGERGYRLRLFLRRHRSVAVVTAFGLACAAIGLGAGLKLREAATHNAQAAHAMRRLFENSFDVLTTGGLGQSPLMSAAMLRDAEANLRRSDAVEGTPLAAVDGLVLMALARSYTVLGDYRHALALIDEAQALAAGHPEQNAPIQAALAHLLNIESRYAQARGAVESGLADIDAVPPPDRDFTRLMLEVELARAHWGMADIGEANALLQQAMTRAEAMAARDPTPLAALLIQRGQWRRLFSRYEDAMRDFERAAALTSTRAPIVADGASAELARTLDQLGQHARAVEVAGKLLQSRRRMLGEEHPETGKAWVVLGDAQFWNGQLDAALESAQRGEAILSAALGAEHPETAQAAIVIGSIQAQTGKPDEAVASARRVLAIMEKAHGAEHQATLKAVGHLAATLAVQASARPGETAPWQEVIALYARKVDAGTKQGLPMLSERMFLIKAKLRVGRIDPGTEQELERVIAALGEARGRYSDAARSARFTQIEVDLQQERVDRAVERLETLLRELDRAPPSLSADGDRFNCHERLGDIAQQRGQPLAARNHWEQSLAIGQRIGPQQVSTQRVKAKLAALDPDAQARAGKSATR